MSGCNTVWPNLSLLSFSTTSHGETKTNNLHHFLTHSCILSSASCRISSFGNCEWRLTYVCASAQCTASMCTARAGNEATLRRRVASVRHESVSHAAAVGHTLKWVSSNLCCSPSLKTFNHFELSL